MEKKFNRSNNNLFKIINHKTNCFDCKNTFYLFYALNFNWFFQFNSVKNTKDKLIDLLFGTVPNLIIKSSLDPVVPLDHFHLALTITLHIQISIPRLDNIHTFYDFRKANYDAVFSYLLSFNIEILLCLYMILIQIVNVFFYDTLNFCILNSVPKRNFIKTTFPVWFSK